MGGLRVTAEAPGVFTRGGLDRVFAGVRQITVANPAPRSGKSTTVRQLARLFQAGRSDVSVWDAGDTAADEFGRERDELGRRYPTLIVDTGADPRPALDATDQLVIPVANRDDSVNAAEALLTDLERGDQRGLARHAIVLVAVGSTGDDVLRPLVARFGTRTRKVFSGPAAWTDIAHAVADGL